MHSFLNFCLQDLLLLSYKYDGLISATSSIFLKYYELCEDFKS